jgi:hypothetical protein
MFELQGLAIVFSSGRIEESILYNKKMDMPCKVAVSPAGTISAEPPSG